MVFCMSYFGALIFEEELQLTPNWFDVFVHYLKIIIYIFPEK